MLRIAFVGKGGAGKSVLAGTLARILAARGEPVLAIDSDPLPGLAFSIGVERSDAGLPDEAIAERGEGEEGPPYRLRDDLDPLVAIDRFAAHGPDGIRFLQFGKVGGEVADLRRSMFAFRGLTDGLDGGAWHVIGDLPAGTRQAFFGWGGYARTVLVVTEPSAASRVSARRLARLRLADDPPDLYLVASKVDGPDDVSALAEAVGLEAAAAIPRDEAVRECEHLGVPLLDHAPDAPAVAAICSLADLLMEDA